MHHDDGAPSSPKLREKLCQATWDSWFLDVTSSSGLFCLRRIINPLENRRTCFLLYPEGWTAHFLFLQLKPHCHSVLLSVMKYGGKLWAGRGREEQLPVQGHRVNMRYPVGFKFTGKQWGFKFVCHGALATELSWGQCSNSNFQTFRRKF